MVAFARFVPAQLFPFPLANVHLSDFRPRNFVKPPEYSTLSNSAMFSSFNESNEVVILHHSNMIKPAAGTVSSIARPFLASTLARDPICA